MVQPLPVASQTHLCSFRRAGPVRCQAVKLVPSASERKPVVRETTCDARQRHMEPLPRALLSAGFMLASSAMLLASPLPAQSRLELPNKEVDNATSPLVQELLKRTAENKERYARERLQDYYRRNFKEYFEFEAQNAKVARARGISVESQQAIAKWLEENK